MSSRFEELDWRTTPLGAVSLRRRRDPLVGTDVYEVKLDDDFLMSSLNSPRHLLHPGHTGFYRPGGVRRLASHLHPGGVFALWSNDPPDTAYTTVLADAFHTVAAKIVTFHNPLQERDAANTVYLATTAPDSSTAGG